MCPRRRGEVMAVVTQHHACQQVAVNFRLLTHLRPWKVNVDFIPTLRSPRKLCTNTINMSWFRLVLLQLFFCPDHSWQSYQRAWRIETANMKLKGWETTYTVWEFIRPQSKANPRENQPLSEDSNALDFFKLRFCLLFHKGRQFLFFFLSLLH